MVLGLLDQLQIIWQLYLIEMLELLTGLGLLKLYCLIYPRLLTGFGILFILTDWLLNLILIYKTLWTGAESGLLISMLEKLNFFSLTVLITLVLLMWKWMGQFLRENHLRLTFSLKLDWGSYIFLLLKLLPRKIEPCFALWSFFLLRFRSL